MIFKRPVAAIIAIVILVGGLASLPISWNDSLQNALVDLLFKLRGERTLSDDILIVFVGSEDVKQLNGWPITRDYYGYMTHILQQSGAKVIGFDLLFDTPDSRYPEFDEMFAKFIELADNVCLPMTFAELFDSINQASKAPEDTLRLTTGNYSSYPIGLFRSSAAGIGFSNLGDETIVRKVPLVANSSDTLMFSFGCELARLFWGGLNSRIQVTSNAIKMYNNDGIVKNVPIDSKGRMRLNHFTSLENLSAVSFVELFQTYQSSPDSLNLNGKMVLVAVTSPGIAPLKVTPLIPALPASFIHATVAENIIEGNYLRELSVAVEWLASLALALALIFAHSSNRRIWVIGGSICAFLTYLIITVAAFKFGNLIVPMFYPLVGGVLTLVTLRVHHFRSQRRDDIHHRQMLQAQIHEKQAQLQAAEAALLESQAKLNLESEENQRLLIEKKKQVEIFEKQISDLQKYSASATTKTTQEFSDIVFSEKSKMTEVLELVGKIGSDDIAVLLTGETGTGKEVVARAIHRSGKRRRFPFVAVNCGALPETLLESELFGHEKGAFTGAQSQRKGRFELADGGTLFLDEITETSSAFQSKLLRVLQEGSLERLGGERTIKVNVRVIAASSKDLNVEVQAGRFRVDLFYRLNGFPITLPPLRERVVDVPLLATHFLEKHGYQSISGFSDQAMKVMSQYQFPGNVRELENLVRRAAIMATSVGRTLIRVEDLPPHFQESDFDKGNIVYQSLEDQILEMLRTLRFSHSAISQTARALGNRDRGTITEYFRGLCFQNLVDAEFDAQAAAKSIAGSEDREIIDRIGKKIEGYLSNLNLDVDDVDVEDLKMHPQFKGLPKKYHDALSKIIAHYRV